MKEMKEKYANLLVSRCVALKKKQPLLITAPIEAADFVRLVAKKALEIGCNDIYFDWTDDEIKHDLLNYLDDESIKNSKLFNKNIYDEYAKKHSAFLMLVGEDPDAMKDIDSNKIALAGKVARESRNEYRKLQRDYIVPWCIASVPTDAWAKKVFPKSKNAKENLWNLVFKMCLIDTTDPVQSWNEKVKKNKEIVKKLNDLNIKTLHYKNKLGTDFEIGFKNNKWCGADEKTKEENIPILVNMPTEEIFTTPNKYSANGKVYASKPLVYNSSLIDDFWLEFKDGKVIDYDAKIGKEILKSIIEIENGNYLGECALVDKNSPISKSNVLFYETLYDENASCHLALGSGFTNCIKNNKSLEENEMNDSKTHVDFMIGTDDLEIVASTYDNKEVIIMKNGEYNL